MGELNSEPHIHCVVESVVWCVRVWCVPSSPHLCGALRRARVTFTVGTEKARVTFTVRGSARVKDECNSTPHCIATAATSAAAG